jgi:cytoskeleton protein RodZ
LPREQAVVAEKVPPVPDRLLASHPAAPPSSESATPATASTAPATTTTTSQRAQDARNAPGTLPPEAWPTPRRDPVAAQLPQAQPQPQPAPLAPPVVSAVPTPPPVVLPAIGQAQAAQPPAQAEQPRVTTQQPAPAAEEAVVRPPAADAASLPVRVDTPITVRANSWIELRAPNGDVLAQTYVRAGESYVVPAGIAYRITAAR